ncbi:MAG: DUF4397 domain-containing protein, partial [Anaerolineae bacterium]|nr:DUF4397 domain-containing protein [Anaerolineae bacterium]
MRRNQLIVVWLTVAAIMMAACAPSTPPPTPTNTPAPTAEPTATATPAFVPRVFTINQEDQIGLRSVHAVEGLENVDIYAELSTVALNLGFGTASAGDSRLAGGTYTFRVVPSGGGIDAVPIVQQTIDLAGGNTYTLLLSGDPAAPTLTAIPDDHAPLAAGYSRVMVINAVADVPSLQVTGDGGSLLVDALAYGQSSAPITVEAGNVNFQTRIDGRRWFDLPLDLRELRQITVLIMGTRDNWTIDQAETDVPGQAQIRVFNGLDPETGSVDVYLGDTQLAHDLAFGGVTDPSEQPTTLTSLRIVAAGQAADSVPLLATTIAPSPGDVLTLIAVGNATNNRLITYNDDSVTLDEGEASITFIHLIPGIDTIRSGGTDGVMQEPVELDFGQPTTFTTIAGAQQFIWQPAFGDNSGDPLFESNLTLAPNTRYLYLITNREDAPAVVLERTVEVLASAAQQEQATTQVRWINAIPDSQLSFSLGDTVQVSDLGFASASDIQMIVGGDFNLLVTSVAGSSSTPVTLTPYHRYSIYARGDAAAPQITVIEDPTLTFPPETGRIRLVQISGSDSASLSLWFAAAPETETNDTFSITPVPDPNDQPVNLPFGVRRLVIA